MNLAEFTGDAFYSLKEWNKLRKFKKLIRDGIEKCEPRYRHITDLATEPVLGSVEFAHIMRYRFATNLIGSGHVLNAACGSGYGNAILANAGTEPIGVDLFDEPLALAHQYFPQGEYVRADAQNLNMFRDDSFDSVVSFETIEHVSDPVLACNEFRRVLKHGGIFVGSIPIMVFHNPGTNFTWQAALDFVVNIFPNANLYLQDNRSIAPLSLAHWRTTRHEGDKYLLWVWRKVAV